LLDRSPAFNALRIDGLKLAVRLGCSVEERLLPQEVIVTVELRFRESPKGVLTDALADTVCYAEISDSVRKLCESVEYKLVEKMAYDVYRDVHRMVLKITGSGVEVGVSIHKVRPPVENLRGGVFFRCGDFAL
jgi:dihydroneopterin aldolase